MKRFKIGVLSILVLALGVSPGLAQGPTSGSINGTVTDNTGAVLPGVTVTATSPAMMGAQTATTNDQGHYRFPSLTPGEYRLSYELGGFSTVVREKIVVNIGFAATVNTQLTIATLQETVTVSGASPVVDLQNTNVQTNFTSEMLRDIPNARDIWSLIAEAPGMMVTRFDVGGSRAGTQTGYSAFGYSGQVRVQIDGVNTTEGTGAAGFYYDYGSFEEIQLGADGNDASAPTPGLQLNAVLKSGGNELRGDVYFDYENESLQGQNVDDRLRRLGVGEGTRITKYYDPNVSVGGPIKRDRLWYFASFRNQEVGVTAAGFPVDQPSDFEFLTRLQNLSYKVTYQLSANNKISQYVQVGRKLQPHRNAGSTQYLDAVFKQDSISYAANIDWNSIVSPRFFFNTRFSTFGYNWPDLPYGVGGELNQNLRRRMTDNGSGNTAGAFNARRNDRRRYQFDWSSTLFQDDWIAGSHAIKMGLLNEWESQEFTDEGFLDAISLTYDSPAGAADFSRPLRVSIRNTPRRTVNSTWHHGAYLHDQWTVSSRVTLNLGIRWDYYSSYYPDQEILPHRFRDFFYAGAALPNGFSIPASPYAGDFEVPGRSGISEYPRSFAPRFGLAWDLFGTGKTVFKANWGRFYHNTGLAAGDVNPLSGITYTFNWNDVNRDRLFQDNEYGSFSSSSGGTAQLIDPNLKHTYTDSTSVWLEREIVANVGARVGYTYRSDGNNSEDIELQRLGSLYTFQRTFTEPGPDGIAGNGDDGPPVVAFDIPTGVAIPPSRTEVRTVPGIVVVDRAFDITVNKRMSNRWSMVTNFIYNWDRDKGFPQNPNQERFSDQTVTSWAFKAFGTYQGPWGVVISPVVRHQSGDQLARIVNVNLRVGTLGYRAEKIGSYREDNITIFDTRLEKRFRVRDNTLSLFFDAFNINNSNAAESMDSIVGRRTVTVDGEVVNYPRFMRPTITLAPRVYRVGFKYAF